MPPIYIYITTCSERVSTTSVPLIQISGTQVSTSRTRVSRLQSVARVHTRAATERVSRLSQSPEFTPELQHSCNIAATELQQSEYRAYSQSPESAPTCSTVAWGVTLWLGGEKGCCCCCMVEGGADTTLRAEGMLAGELYVSQGFPCCSHSLCTTPRPCIIRSLYMH